VLKPEHLFSLGENVQKSLSEIVALPEEEVLHLIAGRNEPVLVTHEGEPRFIAQSLEAYETLVRRLRILEAESRKPRRTGIVIPFRR
jgi:hypothetical protein